jgi:hypothetical protein
MAISDFTTTLLVEQSPTEVFNAINNVRGWWSEEIEGITDKLNEEFTYHYEDVHRCKIKLIEVIQDKKVVWLVLDNYFNFTYDKNEWKGTKIIFEISQKDTKTQIRFTHLGLVPGYECYEVCRDAWSNYINNSLRSLITTGKGQPNPKEEMNDNNEDPSKKMNIHDFQTGITVNVTPDEAFKDINNVTKWWTENLEGNSQQLNDEFTVRFGDMHYSKQKLVEIIQGEKIVWLVTGSNLSWLNNKHEWNNTIISFEITRKDNKTRIHFTHFGLVPEIECYNDCSNAWNSYIHDSLYNLITTGKGEPDPIRENRPEVHQDER